MKKVPCNFVVLLIIIAKHLSPVMSRTQIGFSIWSKYSIVQGSSSFLTTGLSNGEISLYPKVAFWPRQWKHFWFSSLMRLGMAFRIFCFLRAWASCLAISRTRFGLTVRRRVVFLPWFTPDSSSTQKTPMNANIHKQIQIFEHRCPWWWWIFLLL